ncbi:MAG TPA: sigma-70 family RNA polymerase sigma factor, partial [Longimicrobiales bacterium]|nr:sigma-70 family RNA polymerase sigma factor [Longimicrobiales bacterium]
MSPESEGGAVASGERALVAAVIGGDEAAFRRLYRRHTPSLYRVALRMTGGKAADAEDVVQEGWRRAVRSLPDFRFQSALGRWLSAIVVRCALESLRARGRLDTVGPEALPASPRAPHPTTGIDLERAFEDLPDGYRTVLVLHDIEGYKHREIAELLEISPGTSKSQLHRARAWMRRALG